MTIQPGGRPDAVSPTQPTRAASRTKRVASVVVLLALAGCQPAVLDPQGAVGIAEKSILIDSLAIMLAIVIPTIVATIGFAWWYRESNTRAQRLLDWSFSGRVELVTWSIPALTVILLAGVAWIGSHDLDPAKPLVSDKPALEVQVVSLDWKWLFIYPSQGIASVNQLVVPAGVPLHLSLTSASVMNAFFIPQLGSMIYTMNHMAVQLNLVADHPGSFPGLSSHYSGDGFSDMSFTVSAVPNEDFARWVATARTTGAALDDASYAQLAKQSTKVTPFTYQHIEADLFNKIVSQTLPPGPGPVDEASPGASQRAEN